MATAENRLTRRCPGLREWRRYVRLSGPARKPVIRTIAPQAVPIGQGARVTSLRPVRGRRAGLNARSIGRALLRRPRRLATIDHPATSLGAREVAHAHERLPGSAENGHRRH
jgi:hypothetical protein